MATRVSERKVLSEPTPPAPRASWLRVAPWIVLALLIAVGALLVSRPPSVVAPLTPRVVPSSVGDAIPGQRIVVLASFTDGGDVTGPAVVTAEVAEEFAADVTVTIDPAEIEVDEVAEITVVIGEEVVAGLPDDGGSMLGQAAQPRPVESGRDAPSVPETPPPGPVGPEGVLVPVTVTLTRGDVVETSEVTINVSRGEDLLLGAAAPLRDRFVTWLEAERPELGITPATDWTPTIVQPHILVVSHYLFFSEDWEMGLTWHIMIAPHDWSRIYLRPRDELSPTLGFEIPSVSDPASGIVEIEAPPYVDR